MINCTGKAGSNGLPSTDGASCTCLNSTIRFWNSVTLTCDINCSLIPNNNGISDLSTRCSCTSPYTWSVVFMTCLLDCSTLIRAINNSNASACNCLSPYFWNPLSMDCDVNCTQYPCALPGIFDEVVSSTQICACAKSYMTWSTNTTSCVLDCY